MRSIRYVGTTAAAASLLVLGTVAMGTVHRSAPLAAPAGDAGISGKVHDAAGKPVASATISLFAAAAEKKTATDTPAQPKKPKVKAVALATATSDASGAFKFDKIAAGDYVVGATSKTSGKSQTPVTLKAGETKDIELTLSKKAKPGA